MADVVSTPTPTPAAETPTTETPAAKVEAPKVPEPVTRMKLKGIVDGKEVEEEVEYDKLHATWQKGKAADKRLQEAAETQGRVKSLLQRVAKNPFDAGLREELKSLIGEDLDLRSTAAKALLEEYEAEQLKANDPKEFERKQIEKERDEARAEAAKLREMEKQRSFQVQVEAAQKEIIDTYSAALQKTGLPVTEEVFIKMAEIGDINLRHGIKLSPDQLAAETREFFEGYDKRAGEKQKARISALKGEDLLKELGEDLVKEIQNTLITRARERLKKPAPTPTTGKEASQQKDSGGKKEWETDTDILKRLGIPIGF